MKTTTRILRRHIGRPIDFQANPAFEPINGVVESIQHGIAMVRYYMARRVDGGTVSNTEGFLARLEVGSPYIIAIY